MVVQCVFYFHKIFFPRLVISFYSNYFEERFTAPSCAPCCGPAGEGDSGDAWQCAQQRETDFQGAGRVCRQETAIQQSRNLKTANYKVVVITKQKGECR